MKVRYEKRELGVGGTSILLGPASPFETRGPEERRIVLDPLCRSNETWRRPNGDWGYKY